MQSLPSLGAVDITGAVSMRDAIAALREAFSAGPHHIPRGAHQIAGGELLVMPATAGDVAGVKLLMVQPANAARGDPLINGTYVLFDAVRGMPVALLDGAALTALRTPAVSALATDALASADARSLGIIGSGPQALGHVEAMLAVRPGIATVVIASRTAINAEAAAEAIAGAQVGTIGDAAACDIVCALTRATEPVLMDADVRPGTHVNAVGAYRLDMCELDPLLVARATVVVDDRDAAMHEAGDLQRAIDQGHWAWSRVAGDLVDVAAGRITRRDDQEVTLFESVGLAVEDLVVARLAAERLGLL
jgi:ornithine cyclodeaminase/alanine dehydrogenase-like protein (mu-crystallin family)